MNQTELKKLLHYNPATGEFTWLKQTNGIKAGTVAGSQHGNSKRTIYIKGKSYPAQQLAWLYMNGVIPATRISYLDNDKGNIRIANLHISDKIKTRTTQSNNTSGTTGVHYEERNNLWVAKYCRKYLGSFPDKADAVAARQIAEIM